MVDQLLLGQNLLKNVLKPHFCAHLRKCLASPTIEKLKNELYLACDYRCYNEPIFNLRTDFLSLILMILFALIQSNSNIVESNIVENSNIVDDLAATKDFYLIKIQNSRNPK